MQILEITPTEREYVARQLQAAHEDATVAINAMRPPRPGVNPPTTHDMIGACYEAAEHLNDVLQIDVPAEMVEDVRHALQELRTTIDVLDRRREPGVNPPALPVEPLERAIGQLERLEHELRRPGA